MFYAIPYYREDCENSYQDRQCTERCNIEDCQFDGGDCEKPEEKRIVRTCVFCYIINSIHH